MCRCTYIFPAQRGVAVFTVDIGHGMKSCEQQPLLCRATANIHPETTQSNHQTATPPELCGRRVSDTPFIKTLKDLLSDAKEIKVDQTVMRRAFYPQQYSISEFHLN